MHYSRIPALLAILVIANAALVAVSSVYHFANAQDEVPTITRVPPPAFNPNGSLPVATPDVGVATFTPGPSTPSEIQSEPTQVDDAAQENRGDEPPSLSLEIPATLPEVPSLADGESVRSDPIFQEFAKMFETNSGNESPLTEHIESSLLDRKPELSSSYFQSLETRLSVATQLTDSARQLASEAQLLSERQKTDEAREAIRMCHELAEMATKLLAN